MKQIISIAALAFISYASKAQISSSTLINNFMTTAVPSNTKPLQRSHDNCFVSTDSSVFIGGVFSSFMHFSKINGANATSAKVASVAFLPNFFPMLSYFVTNSNQSKYLYIGANTIKAQLYAGTGGNLTHIDSFGLSFEGVSFAEHGNNFYLTGKDSLYYFDFASLQYKAKLPGIAKAIASNGISAYITCLRDLGSNKYMYYACRFNNNTLSIIDSAHSNNIGWASIYDYSFPKENVKDIVIGFGAKTFFVSAADVMTTLTSPQEIIRQYGVVNNKIIVGSAGNSGISAIDITTKNVEQLSTTDWLPSREVESNGKYIFIPDYDSTITITQGTAATTTKGKLPAGFVYSFVNFNYGLCGDAYVTQAKTNFGSVQKYGVINANGTSYVFDSIVNDGSNLFPQAITSNSAGLYSIHKQTGSSPKKLVKLNPCAGSSTVGGIELAYSASAKVYPNPATTQLIFETTSQGSELSIHNLYGQKVYGTVVKNDITTINTSNWQPGLYLLSYNNASYKIVKE